MPAPDAADPPALPHTPGVGTRLFFGGTLCPDERAWKLRVRFARVAAFSPEELWKLSDLSDIPLAGVGRGLGEVARTERQGVTLRLSGLVRFGSYPAPGVPEGRPYRTGFDVIMTPAWPDRQLTLVRAADEHDRELIPRFKRGGHDRYRFMLYSAAPPRKLNLTFAVQRCRFVEFLAAAKRS